MLLVKKKLRLSRRETIGRSIIKVNVFSISSSEMILNIISLTGTVEFSQENITIWSADASSELRSTFHFSCESWPKGQSLLELMQLINLNKSRVPYSILLKSTFIQLKYIFTKDGSHNRIIYLQD